MYIATLAIGLRSESRVATKLAGRKNSQIELLFARLIDEVSFIAWTKTKDAQHNRNRPESMVRLMLDGPKEKEFKGFNTPEDFERAKMRILRGL